MSSEKEQIDDLELEMEKLKLVENKIKNNEFWKELVSQTNLLKRLKDKIEYLLEQFGTKEPCNRFDVGNTIEFIICDHIRSCGFDVKELPNAKRFDIDINNYKKLSIKYSSVGDITLHNSNGSVNKDMEMKDTILLTPDNMYFISIEELSKIDIDISDHIKNCGDSLKLKRKLLKILREKNYSFVYSINISHDKEKCKNRLCSKVFYDKFNEEYELLFKQ